MANSLDWKQAESVKKDECVFNSQVNINVPFFQHKGIHKVVLKRDDEKNALFVRAINHYMQLAALLKKKMFLLLQSALALCSELIWIYQLKS